MHCSLRHLFSALALSVLVTGTNASAAGAEGVCAGLPSHRDLKAALAAAKAEKNGGFGTEMWATVVNRQGLVCAVVHTGNAVGDQWPGSRAISAAKAYTANAFSLPTLAVSTANLYTATQPGGPLFGLENGNPLDVSRAYGGFASSYGTEKDPLVGDRIGGTIVFGGGLALYNSEGTLVGAIGVSGDSSCADHHIAWRARNQLKLDYVPGGVSGKATHPDTIVYDISKGSKASASGWGHPSCGAGVEAIAAALPAVSKIAK